MNARLVATSLAAVVLVAGCSSSGNVTVDTPAVDTTAGAPTTGAPTTQSPSTTEPAPESSSAQESAATSAGGLSGALLTTTALGPDYTGGPRPPAEGTPMPCTPTKPPLSQQVPPTERANAEFKNAVQQMQVGESISQYSDEATAQRAFTAAVAGFSCTSGKMGSATMKIVPKPARAGSATDELKAWDFGDGKTAKGTVVAVRVGNRLVGLTFVVPAAKDASGINLSGIVNKATTLAKQG